MDATGLTPGVAEQFLAARRAVARCASAFSRLIGGGWRARFLELLTRALLATGRRADAGRAAPAALASHPEVDAARISAAGFCLGGSIVLTWACTDNRLTAIAPFLRDRAQAAGGDPPPVPGRRLLARIKTSPPKPPGCWKPS